MKYKEFLEHHHPPAASNPPPSAKEFKAAITQLLRNHGKASLDELNAEIDSLLEDHNSAVRYEFAGLSAHEVSQLIYHPFENGSPIQFRAHIADEVFDKIGFLRLVEELLKIIKRDGHIKLTAKLGALPRKVLLELYDHHFLPEPLFDAGHFALRVEADSAVMGTLHGVTYLSGMVRKLHGKLVLTKLGEQMLSPKSRRQLFEIVFSTFTRKFNWAYNDGYPEFPLCRDAFGFSLYLVARLGSKEVHKDFYAERFLTAFPQSLDEFENMTYSAPERLFTRCYRLRTFDRFLEWFNLVEVRPHKDDEMRERSLVKRSAVMDEIFVTA